MARPAKVALGGAAMGVLWRIQNKQWNALVRTYGADLRTYPDIRLQIEELVNVAAKRVVAAQVQRGAGCDDRLAGARHRAIGPVKRSADCQIA